MLTVNSKKISKGIRTDFQGKSFDLKYPGSFWKNYPENMKSFLLDNIAFMSAYHLPIFFNEDGINFNTAEPLLKPWFKEMLLFDIPISADQENKSTTKMLFQFLNLEIKFEDPIMKFPDYNGQLEEKAIVNFTFGKESLVTFGLCRELGIESDLVYFEAPNSPIETKLKRMYVKKFSKLFNQNIIRVFNGHESLSDAEALGLKDSEWGYGNQLTQYCLEALPLIHTNKDKFILFGNEKSCNSFYINGEGYKSYPVFDQSTRWMVELNNVIRLITNKQASMFSLVEPINELSVVRILHHRYKDLGKFQFSCFPDNHHNGIEEPWCHACSKCARIYLFLKAVGADVKKVGFHEDLFNKEHMHIFSLFNGKTENSVSYDYSGLGRDEQLFAFYLAMMRGERGDLVELFKQRFLEEAKQREDELYKEFFGIFDAVTIPNKLRPKVTSIFKEELSNGFM